MSAQSHFKLQKVCFLVATIVVVVQIVCLAFMYFSHSYFSVAHSLTDHNGLCECESFHKPHTENTNEKNQQQMLYVETWPFECVYSPEIKAMN